jgi:hypothetical protein
MEYGACRALFAILVAEDQRLDAPMLRNACAVVFFLIAIPAGAETPDPFRSAPGLSMEEIQWQHVESQPSTAAISDFLHRFPDSPHRDEAQKILRGLNMLEATQPPSASAPTAVRTGRASAVPRPAAQPSGRAIGSSTSARCASISERSQLGEGIPDADRTFLAENCR